MSSHTPDRPLHRRKATLLAAEARRPARPKAKPPATSLEGLLARLKLQQRSEPIRRTCGAQTRKGTPCKALGLANGRCRNHGGMSTGPKTAEGWARTRVARAAYWAARKLAKSDINNRS